MPCLFHLSIINYEDLVPRLGAQTLFVNGDFLSYFLSLTQSNDISCWSAMAYLSLFLFL